ncbi:hypothetical protein ACWDUL_37495 [Nocardia niigatensis]|uniref:hypothetical protein n=1 Tax=Nocardia niigatensis TaxID=209249 RepID=UPI000594AAA6|nr:hypothetical protein [Nocardia niigatensis]
MRGAVSRPVGDGLQLVAEPGAAWAAGQPLTGGQLFGPPPLDGDVWVGIAGARAAAQDHHLVPVEQMRALLADSHRMRLSRAGSE